MGQEAGVTTSSGSVGRALLCELGSWEEPSCLSGCLPPSAELRLCMRCAAGPGGPRTESRLGNGGRMGFPAPGEDRG